MALGDLFLLVSAWFPSAADSHLEVVTRVLENLSERDESSWLDGRDRLARIGPRLAPLLFDILVGRVDLDAQEGAGGEEDSSPLLDARSEAFLREVLTGFPAVEVAKSLRESVGPEAGLDERWVAVRILGECGDQACVEDFFALLEPVDEIQLGRPYVRATVEDALSAILLRDPNAHASLLEVLPGLEPALLPSVIGSLGRTARTASILVLLDLLSDQPDLAPAILVELGRPDLRDYDSVEEECSRAARRFLSSGDRSLQKSAIDLLGNLRDEDAAEECVARIDAGDPGMNRVVLRALRQTAGLDLGEQREPWRQWLAAEEAWAITEARETREEASSPDPVVATAALRRISEHPLFHRTLYLAALPALRHDDESVVRSACRTLESLDDPGALDALVDLLSDPRDGVRTAAHHALVSLSRQELPPLAEPWSRWLRN